MSERDLSVVASQNIQTEQCDRIGDHQRELKCAIIAQKKRQRDCDQQQYGNRRLGVRLLQSARDVLVRSVSAGFGLDCHCQTRDTTDLPNRPEGRTVRTPTMITSANVSFRSVPMT